VLCAVAKFYKSAEVFTCITNPTITLPLSAVNDNYCDCPDGSDEPGTSACSHLSSLSPPQPLPGTPSGTTNTTPALPGFYCKNKGHMPAYAPFDYVNDGVCDYAYCCDGSDEWERVGGVHCEDRCVAMGKEWKKAGAERQKGRVAAGKKRKELVAEAERLRIGIVDMIWDLEVEIKGLQVKAEDAKRKLEETERRERGRVVKGASKKASRVTVLAALAKRRVEELRNGLETAIVKTEQAKGRVRELEDILKTFKEEYNPNFNDEGVKRAVKAWEDYAARGLPAIDEASAEERDLDEIIKPDTEEIGINWAEWEAEEEESDVEASTSLVTLNCRLPSSKQKTNSP
jgi:protein kinase C substrate 80K-H